MPQPLFPYGRLLAHANTLVAEGFRRWLFLPGTEFLAREKWWGRGGARQVPHEGVDFCLFEAEGGRRYPLQPGSLVPAALAGLVVKIHPDFLGHTLWLAHGGPDEEGGRLHTLYGHLVPAAGLAPGSRVAAGEVVGTVADPVATGKAIPAHLHFSVARIAAVTPVGRLDWSLLRDRSVAQLIDPLTFPS